MEEPKKHLEVELSTLTNELKSIAVYNSETGDWVSQPEKITTTADLNEHSDTVEEWNERRALVAQLETRYHNVLIALKKFENDTYGKCEICNDHIEPERLKVNLAARTCKMHIERGRELPF